MPNFQNLNYLKHGTAKQVRVYAVLTEHSIVSRLAAFEPLLVGTIPIHIDIENSDLDIICYWEDKNAFTTHLKQCFGGERSFTIRELVFDNEETVVANFIVEEFEIEVFGQNLPVTHQNGYKHLLIEHEILKDKGETFRLEIIKLKQNGYKTEPAFALLLGLKGNPYQELLNYKV